MSDFIPTEKGVPIRMPSTANLCVDSLDSYGDLSGNLPGQSVWNFTIQPKNSIFNGFFTRIGLTEIALKWDTPNISSRIGNNTLLLDISGAGANPYTLTFPNQFANTAADILDGIKNYVNDISGTTGGFTFTISNGQNTLRPSTYQMIGSRTFKFRDTTLAQQMNIYSSSYQLYVEPTAPDLRPFAYIDFVSPNLTYNQDLKDGSTNKNVVDVLQRFYFAEEFTAVDKYNFPILLGYSPFVIVRAYNPPKQIKWSAQQPIGQLQFQLYGQLVALDKTTNRQYGLINLNGYGTSYNLTLQVSEV